MPDEKIIHVEWEGPFSHEGLKSLNSDWDYGVYQIYGTHTVYGAGVLLYIGMAAKQTFGVRIPQEGWPSNQDGNRVEIYVGRLSGSTTPENEEWNKQISQVENLLIYAHAPATNSKNIQAIRERDFRNIHVLNWGQFRNLLPEVSGHRWTERHGEISGYMHYGLSDESD